MSETVVLGSPVRCSDTQGGLPFLRPRVSGVVLDPSTTRLEYLIVHRGLLGGQDQCVPAAYLTAARPDEVVLGVDLETLKAMPALEVKLRDQGYIQRSIPLESILLGKSTPVRDEAGHELGHFYGVMVSPEHRLERILLDRAEHPGVDIGAIASCGEDCIQVGQSETAASAPPTLAPGTKVRDPVCDMEVLADTAVKAQHQGQTYYFCSLSCKQQFELDPTSYVAKARAV
jgi:YHS domain-containing protein